MGFTNRQILDIALRQSATDLNCNPADFLRDEPVLVPSQANPGARKYLHLPLACHLVSYGNNVVAAALESCRELVSAYIRRFPAQHCFETPNLHILNDALEGMGQRICYMAEYFLPDLGCLEPLECPYPLKILHQQDFGPLYVPTWANALCKERRELDVLGVAAYDGEQLIGLAGCSADCDEMWQIGIDVLPAYRRQGVASALTSRLALEILERGMVPFYCAAWSNVKSVRNAVKCGFRPAWVEMSAKSTAFVEKLNTKD